MTALRAGAATDVGRVRSSNQDQLLVTERLFAVADGMGGHAGGEVAALTAVEALRAAFGGGRSTEGLAEAVRNANQAVWKRARERRDLHGMGTTLTAVALVEVDGEELLAVANVGDSRAYLFRDGELDQLTEDHSVPEELLRAGRLSPEEAAAHPQRNVLTRALGIDPDVDIDCFEVTPYRGDRVLLGSDGLFNEVDDGEIASVLRRLDDPDAAARELVTLARDQGGNDNITVVIVDVVDDDDRSARASAALADNAAAPGGTQATLAAPVERPAPAPTTAQARAAPPPRAGRVAPPEPRRRRVTFRVVGFVLVLVLVLAAAVAAVAFYARGSYHVGVEAEEVVIFKGRPGGLLWFEPTVEERTGVPLTTVRAGRVSDLRNGKAEPSLGAARRYVDNLREEAAPPGATPTTPTSAPSPPPPAP